MLAAFSQRRPWAAALVGLVLGPFVGMLYLGAGTKALTYLAVVLAIYSLPPVAAHLSLLPFDAETAVLVLVIIYRLAGAVHCERVARERGGEAPSAGFARWYAVLGIGVVLPVGLRALVWEPYSMPSASMEPSLRVGDYIIAEKLPYHFREPRRGDLVVFLSPEDDTTPYVKRLVGLPGDTVQMRGGTLYLNGEAVPREAISPKPESLGSDFATIYREFLPGGGSYLIREISDVRPLDETEVFTVPSGQYFFLGDNRDNSLDSRTMLGTGPHENIIGRVIVILWNSEDQKLRLFDGD